VLADGATLIHAHAPNAPKNLLKFLIRVTYPRNYPPRE